MNQDLPAAEQAALWRQQARMCGFRQDLVAFCLEQAEDIERRGDTTLAELIDGIGGEP